MSAPDHSAAIAALRLAGADQFDPVRLHYLHALAQRASAHEGMVKHLLDAKLAQALVVFTERFAQFNSVAPCQPTPHKSAPRTSLADLAHYRAQQLPVKISDGFEGHAGVRPELTATRYFRDTWSKISIGKRVTQALDQAPKNAGPINSHMLVLRSLALMRDIAPDYLNRFTSYADTLLSLDQCDGARQAIAKKAVDVESGKAAKSRRIRVKQG